MSGRQIGTVVGGVVGAVVGFYAGNPYLGAQIGMSVGGLVGGAVDPTKIYGPHVGDGQAQSATDGSPIAWVMGTAWVAGCIVDLGASQEFAVKQDTGGKGSGTEQYSYEAHQNFSILVCESDAIKGSTIQSVLMVEQDGKIVYDMRPGSTILSDSAKYQSRNFRLYYGAEDQEPLSDYDGDHGVGNEPAYRGVLLAFFTQFNKTAAGGRIPNFRFLVSSSAALDPITASGGDGWADDHTVTVDSTPGWFTLYYATGGIPDKFEVWDGETLLASTPWVGDTAYQSQLDTTLASHSEPSSTIQQYPYPQGTDYPPGVQFSDQWADPSKRSALSFHKTSTATSLTVRHYGLDGTGWTFGVQGAGGSPIPLSDMVSQICQRGGVGSDLIDVSDLAGTSVQGYTIAKQMNAVNALGPLLGSYFAYASEYDGKINFHFYGADAVMTIDEDDLLAETDANDSNVTSNLRNNATEFPKRIIGQYYDPAQNYMPVTVMEARKAAGVTATGDLAFDIPVAMDANTAQQTVNKAMKVAYAQLEGTMTLSVPFAGPVNLYITLVAGDAVLFRGRRWIVTNPIISNGYIKLTLQYDRQDAYTSNVQAIPGLDPTPPESRYSGPTTLYAMNLPSLRPQDTYGLYLAAKGTNDQTSWRGCNVQVSYDGQQSWQNALTITQASTLGTVALAEPAGGEPLTVDVGSGTLESVTTDQLAAQMNAFALVNGNTAEIGQFQNASQQAGGTWNLTAISRGLLGTTETPATAGQEFTMLDSVYFLPIDTSFAGKTIALRAVGFGETADDQPVVTITYNPDTTVIVDGGA